MSNIVKAALKDCEAWRAAEDAAKHKRDVDAYRRRVETLAGQIAGGVLAHPKYDDMSPVVAGSVVEFAQEIIAQVDALEVPNG